QAPALTGVCATGRCAALSALTSPVLDSDEFQRKAARTKKKGPAASDLQTREANAQGAGEETVIRSLRSGRSRAAPLARSAAPARPSLVSGPVRRNRRAVPGARLRLFPRR